MSVTLVADCSVCVAWALKDERSEESDHLLRMVLDGSCNLVVPDLWWTEFGNALWSAVRRDRITEQSARTAMTSIDRLPVRTVPTKDIGMNRILDAAFRQDLTLYDATYFALAESTGTVLITQDRDLLRLAPDHRWIRSLDEAASAQGASTEPHD